MKNILSIILVLLMSASGFSQSGLRDPAVMARMVTKGASGGGGSSFLLETFEGTGYVNTWTEVAVAGIDEDYTTAPLAGSQSLRIAPTEYADTSTSFAALDTVYIRGKFSSAARVSGVMSISLNGATDSYRIRVYSDNKVYLYNAAQVSGASATTMVNGTPYFFWGKYVKGTGANGVSQLWLSTTGTKPGSPELDIQNGFAILSITNLTVKASNNDDFKVDSLELSTTELGNFP